MNNYEDKILIIGYGVVGHNLERDIKKLNPDIVDIYKNVEKHFSKHHIGFVCVDTPIIDNYDLDTKEVENAINQNDCDIYVLKSTCPIGTVDKLKEKTGKRIIFSPEYYGGTQHCNNFEFNFTILGGDEKDCLDVIQYLQKIYDGRHTFRIVKSKEAEIVKFMENSFLATKVSFCNDFFNLCEKEGVAYENVRELFVLDSRVNPSHTFVYRDKPYWDTHCLNKDVPYVAYNHDMQFLKNVCNFNQSQKNKNN